MASGGRDGHGSGNYANTGESSSSVSSFSMKWSQNLEQAQRLANEGAKLEFAKDYSSAFTNYVRAGELYLGLFRTFDDRPKSSIISLPGENGIDAKTRIRKAAEKVLNRAQLIKSLREEIKPVERRILDHEEQSRVIQTASRIGNVEAPVWKSNITFNRSCPRPALAPVHIQQNAIYRSRKKDKPFWGDDPLYNRKLRGSDIVQDVVNDCSFVAALEVAVEYDAKWGTNLAIAPLYPKDDDGVPQWDESGYHQIRFKLNGVDRMVVIDDAIPCDQEDRPMCAVGISKHIQLWPALLEKAYLSIRGEYDFEGSNSSIDLHLLTGWIPEIVGFHHAGFQRERVWDRLIEAYESGMVLITAGTSKATNEEELISGNIRLVRSHNYAILDLTDQGYERKLTLMNPWRQRRGGNNGQNQGLGNLQDLIESLPGKESIEKFAISWDDACARLDALYLSWNPARFKHSTLFHGMWRASKKGKTEDVQQHVSQNVQVILRVESIDGEPNPEVWLHLVRHFPVRKFSGQKSEWIAIHAFDCQDEGRIHDHKCIGTYIDSTHALTRFKSDKKRHVIVASRQSEQNDINQFEEGSFTVTAYSNAKLFLEEMENIYPYDYSISGQWTSRSAGGNALQPTFVHNPQYAITINPDGKSAQSCSTRIMIETSKELPIQALLIWSSFDSSSNAQRVDKISPGDVVCSSGSYSYGLAICETTKLRPGIAYTLIVSTFSPDQLGSFQLNVQTQNAKAEIKPIPNEGAGMHQQRVRDRWSVAKGTANGSPRFGKYDENPSWEFEVSSKSTIFSARLMLNLSGEANRDSTNSSQKRPFINLSIFDQISREEIVSSGSYVDQVCGVTIPRTSLSPNKKYVIIASTFEPNVEAEFTLYLYSERSINFIKKVV